MTTNPTPADLDQKPSERIADEPCENPEARAGYIAEYGEEAGALLYELRNTNCGIKGCWLNRAHNGQCRLWNADTAYELVEIVRAALTSGHTMFANDALNELFRRAAIPLYKRPEQSPQAEAPPPEPKNSDLDKSVCYCYMYCRPGKCPNVPTAIAPPEPIIRAAEGVTLEPGRYIKVSGAPLVYGDEAERFTVRFKEPARVSTNGAWGWSPDSTSNWVTAVRRVAPVAEPEPVPESDDTGCAKHGNINCSHCLDARRLATVTRERDELRGRLVTIVDEACGLQPVDTSSQDLFTLLEKDRYDWRMRAWAAERERYELRSALQAAEAQAKADTALIRQTRDDALKLEDELRSKVSELEHEIETVKEDLRVEVKAGNRDRATLAATEAKLTESRSESAIRLGITNDALKREREHLREINLLKADLGEIGLDESEAGSCDTPEGAAAEARVKEQLSTRDAELARLRDELQNERAWDLRGKGELARLREERGRAMDAARRLRLRLATLLSASGYEEACALLNRIESEAIAETLAAAVPAEISTTLDPAPQGETKGGGV